MTKKISVVTGNKGKFEDFCNYFSRIDPSIILEQISIDLPEYQSLDIHEIALGKAQHAWEILQKPLLIDDGGIYLERYNRFPGAFSKYVFEGIGLEGFWKLAQDDPRAYFLTCIAYAYGPNNIELFDGKCSGTVIEPSSEILAHKQMPYTKVFVPEGYSQTVAELRDSDEIYKFSHRFKAVQKFVAWLENQK